MRSGRPGRRYLRFEVQEQDAITDARRVVGPGGLECLEAAVSRDNGIGKFLSGSGKLQLPDIDIPGAADATKLFAFAIRFDRSVQPIREDAFDLIVRTRRL